MTGGYGKGPDIINSCTVNVERGEIVSILGPNGAGKTMLLKCLMGFYKPNFGEIQKKDKLKIGYMPQSINVINTMPMTVKNFITVRKKYDDISFKQVIL